MRGASPVTAISYSVVAPSRACPAAMIGAVEMAPRSFATGMPLARDASFSAASERTISPTMRGFVAMLFGITPPPAGVNGCPR